MEPRVWYFTCVHETGVSLDKRDLTEQEAKYLFESMSFAGGVVYAQYGTSQHIQNQWCKGATF